MSDDKKSEFLYGDKEPFKGFDWGTGQIKIDVGSKNYHTMMPREIHHKSDGSVKNEPSFCFLLTSPLEDFVVTSQISLEMLNKGLNDIGYEIVKKKS